MIKQRRRPARGRVMEKLESDAERMWRNRVAADEIIARSAGVWLPTPQLLNWLTKIETTVGPVVGNKATRRIFAIGVFGRLGGLLPRSGRRAEL
jgi:hypothetical protein